MLKEKKLDFERGLQEYCEEQKLYELFESMMKHLIVDQPSDPIAHLIQKLEQPESKSRAKQQQRSIHSFIQ